MAWILDFENADDTDDDGSFDPTNLGFLPPSPYNTRLAAAITLRRHWFPHFSGMLRASLVCVGYQFSLIKCWSWGTSYDVWKTEGAPPVPLIFGSRIFEGGGGSMRARTFFGMASIN